MPEIWHRDSIFPRFEGVIQTVSIIWYLFYLNLTFQRNVQNYANIDMCNSDDKCNFN